MAALFPGFPNSGAECAHSAIVSGFLPAAGALQCRAALPFRRILIASAAAAAWLLLASCGSGTDFERMAGRLRKGNPAERENAASEMHRFGQAGAAPLAAALNDRSKKVRFASIMSLCEIGPPASEAVPMLSILAFSGDDEIRLGALEAMNSISPGDSSVVAITLMLLRDPNDDLRSSAASGLGKARPFSAEMSAALVEALKDRCPDVRREAARSLGLQASFPETAVPALAGLLNDGEWEVRREAVMSLGGFGPQASSAVYAVIETYRRETEDGIRRLKSTAALTIGKIGGSASEAVNELAEGLGSEDPGLKAGCARALGVIGAPAAPAAVRLIPLLASEFAAVRYETAKSIGRIFKGQGTLEALEALRDALACETEIAVADVIKNAIEQVREAEEGG